MNRVRLETFFAGKLKFLKNAAFSLRKFYGDILIVIFLEFGEESVITVQFNESYVNSHLNFFSYFQNCKPFL